MPNAELINSLLVVVGFLVAVFFLSSMLKKSVSKKKILNLGVEFKIVSRLPLSNKSSLYIVQIGNHYLLIGASENNVSVLADLTKVLPTQVTREARSGFSPTKTSPSNFSEASEFSFKNFLKETFHKTKN